MMVTPPSPNIMIRVCQVNVRCTDPCPGARDVHMGGCQVVMP
jgi:hypothetical protein